MRKMLFDQQIAPACQYCSRGSLSADGKSILCPHKGVVTGEYFCRKFRYDPLKRVPKKPVRQVFQKEDFSL